MLADLLMIAIGILAQLAPSQTLSGERQPLPAASL